MKRWQKTRFNFPIFQIIENLIGGAVRAVLDRPETFHVLDVKIRYAPAFDLSSAPKFLECLDGFPEPRASFSPMQKVKIDRVDSKPFETALACFWQFRR